MTCGELWREYSRAVKEHLSAIDSLTPDEQAGEASVLVAEQRHAKACEAIWRHEPSHRDP